MATEKAYTDEDFTSRTGPKDTYILLHGEMSAAGDNIKTIKQDGDGCTIYLNSDLADWGGIDTLVADHTAEPPE